MSQKNEKELRLQVEDRDNALRAIGKVLTDKSLTPPRRIDQAIGIVRMYDLAPVEEVDSTEPVAS